MSYVIDPTGKVSTCTVTQSSTEVLRLKSDMANGRFQRSGDEAARITLKFEDGSLYPHPGKLQFSGVNVNPGTGAVTLRAVVPNPDGLLMPGMYVRTVLEAGVNEQALLVPQQGVTRDSTGSANVLLVDAQNKIERRRIKIDSALGNRWQVVGGLAAGDRVVVDGLQRIKAGDKVNAIEVALQPSASASPQAAQGVQAATAPAPVPAPAASASR